MFLPLEQVEFFPPPPLPPNTGVAILINSTASKLFSRSFEIPITAVTLLEDFEIKIINVLEELFKNLSEMDFRTLAFYYQK